MGGLAARGPVVRRFEQTWDGTLGTTDFTRTNVEEIELELDAISATADGARITYTGPGESRAELTLQPLDETSSRLVVEVRDLPDLGSLAVPLRCDADASFYGFGGQYNATDQRGEAFELFVNEQGIGRDPNKQRGGLSLNGDAHTTYFPMPYFLDARGFGVLAQTARRTLVDLCATDADVAWLEVDGQSSLELVIFHGPTPKDVVAQLGDRVGRPKQPPSWAWELWVGSQGGQADVLAEVDALEAADVPVRAFWVQDWSGIRMNFSGGFGVKYQWVSDPEVYPDLPGMIAELKQRGYRFLSYANPFVVEELAHYADMEAQGLLIQDDEGAVYTHTAPNGRATHPDLTNPATVEYIKGFFREMIRSGHDGWMADFGEWLPLDCVLFDGSDPLEYHNRYPVDWHRVWREAFDEERPDGDYVVFGRSGYTGVHEVSMVHWIGDQEADFSPHDGLPTVVPGMLNLSLSGIPYVTHDIAGFSGGPSTKELFQRWTELGAFTPIMRTHEGDNKLENWSWEKDEETTAHFRRFAKVHLALAEEMQQIASEAAASSLPMVRHLILEFPDDPGSRGISDQFLLGSDLLVAPVLTQGATSREVYLPPGSWFHVWTGEEYAGGQRVTVAAPIGSPPVFSRGADRTDLRAIE